MSHGYCSVPQCSSRAKKNPEISFHMFPKPGKEKVKTESSGESWMCRRDAWIMKVKIAKPVTASTMVCSKHFTKNDFFPRGVASNCRRKLKPNAVPSKNVPTSATSTTTSTSTIENADAETAETAETLLSLLKNLPNNKMNYREDYLEWDEYFMATAFLAAKRSKDPCTQVGACIVNEDQVIIGVGYNGMPKGCEDREFPWGKHSDDSLKNKYMYVCHAELNAVLNKNTANVKNCKIYVGLFPCNECAKVIIQSGIKEVIYLSDKHAHKKTTMASKKMFDAVGVRYRQFVPKHSKIVIDFNQIDWDNMNQLPDTPIKNRKNYE